MISKSVEKRLRVQLLGMLRDFVEAKKLSLVAGGPKTDPEAVHGSADRLLIELLGDEELKEAWVEASNYWWYA